MSNYTTIQKLGVGNIFLCFQIILCSPKQNLFDYKYGKNCNVLQFI